MTFYGHFEIIMWVEGILLLNLFYATTVLCQGGTLVDSFFPAAVDGPVAGEGETTFTCREVCADRNGGLPEQYSCSIDNLQNTQSAHYLFFDDEYYCFTETDDIKVSPFDIGFSTWKSGAYTASMAIFTGTCGLQRNYCWLDDPTAIPTPTPTAAPTPDVTEEPTAEPTPIPTASPTSIPTLDPTSNPTSGPSSVPTAVPSPVPTSMPTCVPCPYWCLAPTPEPSISPTASPTLDPTSKPSELPTYGPTSSPSSQPSAPPSYSPSASPSAPPSASPSAPPSAPPTKPPTPPPTAAPTCPVCPPCPEEEESEASEDMNCNTCILDENLVNYNTMTSEINNFNEDLTVEIELLRAEIEILTQELNSLKEAKDEETAEVEVITEPSDDSTWMIIAGIACVIALVMLGCCVNQYWRKRSDDYHTALVAAAPAVYQPTRQMAGMRVVSPALMPEERAPLQRNYEQKNV